MDSVLIAAEKETQAGWVKLSGRVTLESGDLLRVAGMFFLNNDAALLKFEMSECLFMDSTIMGVLAMLSLEARKKKVSVEVVNITNETLGLLRGLGVDRIMRFIDADSTIMNWKKVNSSYNDSMDSKVILDAHKTLMDIDDENINKFEHVVACLEAEMSNE